MPLHAEDEIVPDAFDAFDDVVAGDRVDDQPSAQRFDGLMMARIDL